MNNISLPHIHATSYDSTSCAIGVVHLGFGAFHRAHQAVYIDDYMSVTNDFRWGIAAVNLRESESKHFENTAKEIKTNNGYLIKSYSSNGHNSLRLVRSHIDFYDWVKDQDISQDLLALETVHLVTITVTESGYYTDANGKLDLNDSIIFDEINNSNLKTVYGYLRNSLNKRAISGGAPITIACCDNIRQNGLMLKDNLITYLSACNDQELISWVNKNVFFPCSMVDRITPQTSSKLQQELSELLGSEVYSPIMAEDFSQWVLQDISKGIMPKLENVGVTVTGDIDPYEETKIRVLNGGHTALTYLAALEKIPTFDAAMRIPHLLEHFRSFEINEVLPALKLDLPFSKDEYLEKIEQRFCNEAIGDTVSRICSDGMAKFPIFIRPTLEGCFEQGIIPNFALKSIASWHQFCLHVAAGNIDFKYVEPNWEYLKSIIGTDDFITCRQLWGDIPTNYPDFIQNLRKEIIEMEKKWPV